MVSKKPSVLIVDDEQVVCDVLYEELSEQGYLCTTATDGNKALGKLAKQHFPERFGEIPVGRINNHGRVSVYCRSSQYCYLCSASLLWTRDTITSDNTVGCRIRKQKRP